MTSRGLLVQAMVFLAAVALADVLLARYARRHFIPETKLATVLAEPEPGLLFVGDSRMVAAMDYTVLRKDVELPIDDLAIGAVDFNGQFHHPKRDLRLAQDGNRGARSGSLRRHPARLAQGARP